MIELTVFLGNPGREYERNRHNAGWLLAERLPFYPSLAWRKKYKGLYAATASSGLPAAPPGSPSRQLHFLMPLTFMNLSGESAAEAAAFLGIKSEAVLVVHDEIELPLGTAAFKFSGGLGGHNGLRSVKACLGVPDFWRLRIGVGRPDHDDISGWVLSDFTASERSLLDPLLEVCTGALTQALTHGPESLLPEWNKKKIMPPPGGASGDSAL
jgi:PTH1 family peptidyl-tRNA hydrolase